VVSAPREQLLATAARLMAERGFHGVTISELGAATGRTGPALYRHFASKQAVLGAMLLDVSQRLLEGGRAVVAAADGPADALEGLLAFHTGFATSEPDLIRVQDRDLASTADADRRQVRALQRAYVEVWVEQLRAVRPTAAEEEARAAVLALIGLLNSTPYSAARITPEKAVALLQELGRAVIAAVG